MRTFEQNYMTEAEMPQAVNWLFGVQDDIDTNIALVVKLIGINSG